MSSRCEQIVEILLTHFAPGVGPLGALGEGFHERLGGRHDSRTARGPWNQFETHDIALQEETAITCGTILLPIRPNARHWTTRQRPCREPGVSEQAVSSPIATAR